MVLPPLTQAGAPNLYQPDAAANRPLPGEMPAQSHTLPIAAPMPLGARRDGERDDRNCECDLSASSQLPVTMGYVPLQKWCNTYDTQTALCRGSLFPELDKPFLGSRGERYVR